MPAVQRSFSDVFQDIVHNFQDILRAEVRLAKTELREDVTKTRVAAIFLGLGAMAGIFGILFLLLAAVYGLSTVVPDWAAALIVGFTLAACAVIAVLKGMKEFKRVAGAPKTTKSIKENVEWAKQQIK